jgi:hypothetical protein
LADDKAAMKKLNEEARNFAGQQLQKMKDEFTDSDVV